MPYIRVPQATAAYMDQIVQVAGSKAAATFFDITEDQARHLAAGTGRVFRISHDTPGDLERGARLISKHITRLQWVEPKGLARAAIPRRMRHLAGLMEGDRTAKRKRDYMKTLGDLGMDPANLPAALAT